LLTPTQAGAREVATCDYAAAALDALAWCYIHISIYIYLSVSISISIYLLLALLTPTQAGAREVAICDYAAAALDALAWC